MQIKQNYKTSCFGYSKVFVIVVVIVIRKIEEKYKYILREYLMTFLNTLHLHENSKMKRSKYFQIKLDFLSLIH